MSTTDELSTRIADSLPNPLRPLSTPFIARGTVLTGFAVWMLLSAAKDMASGFENNSTTVFSVALLLLGVAILDGVRAFRTRVGLPEHSVGMGRIFCNGIEVRDLMLAGSNPNEKYLSWLGRWGARVSGRFAGLPVPYQRLTEVAITALAFAITAAAVFALLAAFGAAAGKSEVSRSVLGWLWGGFVGMAYAFWVAMLWNFLTAAHWARRLSVNRIIKVIGAGIVLLAGASFTVQTVASHVSVAPTIWVQSLILILGSAGIVSVLLVLARLRSSGVAMKITRSRIQVSDTAAVHPQAIPGSFTSILAQTKCGSYHELCDSTVNLKEQSNTAAGIFDALFAGEYGAEPTQIGPSEQLRRFGTIVGRCGICLGGIGLIALGLSARGAPAYFWSLAFGLMLFGELTLLAAYYPLSEILCTSYLMSLKINGSYQKRGVAGTGSIHTDYILDGGLARVTSVCFVPAAMASFDIDRALASAIDDESESKSVMTAVRAHLARAAAGSAAH